MSTPIFWAKTTPDGRPGISVVDHCINVGCVAEALLARLPVAVRDMLPSGAVTLVALHDVGKVSPGFQQQCAVWRLENAAWFRPRDYETRHPLISQVFIERVTGGRLARAAEAIGAHHGLVQGPTRPGDSGGAEWHQAREQVLRRLEAEFGTLPEADLAGEAAEWLLAGLTAVSDWIGSDEIHFPPAACGPLAKATQRATADAIVDKLELAGVEAAAGLDFGLVFAARLGRSSPRPLQQCVIDEPSLAPAVYVIEDAMGSGKTEAALWLLYRLMASGQARGLDFALPTRVTSDRIHRRVKDFLEAVFGDGLEPQLVHGQAWLREVMPQVGGRASGSERAHEEESADKAIRRWFASTRRGLLAPFAVGTVDQALLGVVAAKWFFVRQFALAGKVVVLDEVHSYDLYTGTLIGRLVRQLRELQATPVILSATLTARQKASLLGESPSVVRASDAPYPAISIKSDGVPVRVVEVPIAGNARQGKRVRILPLAAPDFEDIDGVVQEAVRLAEAGHNVVWIRNTVGHAQDAYRKLCGAKREDAYPVGLLHSRFAAYQRGSYPSKSVEELERLALHEERWLWMLGKPDASRPDARPKASILVATQVVEQSVDIDADVLITDLAPTDMLLQRLGRLHRHDRGPRGEATARLVVPETVLRDAAALSADDIKSALGAVGHVYSPYVLVRTLQQWLKRRQLALPGDIRDVLEATYEDLADEPEPWRVLREELEDEKRRLEGCAISAADVRGRPLGPDTEGFGTRYSRQRTVLLLLLRWVSSERDRSGNPAVIQTLNTHKLTRGQYERFNTEAARAVHANVIPVPAWWIPKAVREPVPPGLAQYFHDDVVIGVWEKDTLAVKLGVADRDMAPAVCYRPDIGVWLAQPAQHGTVAHSGDDGEDEDGIV